MQQKPRDDVRMSLRLSASLITWYWFLMLLFDQNGFGMLRFLADYVVLGCFALTGLLLIKFPNAASLFALCSGLTCCILIYLIPIGLPLMVIGVLAAFGRPPQPKKYREQVYNGLQEY